MTPTKSPSARALFGRTADGEAVEAVTLNNGRVTARIISLGASIQSVAAPDRRGRPADILLGHATIEGYLKTPAYFGATVGRVANRIAGARFVLDGETFRTPANDGPNALHGGTKGFDKVVWRVLEASSSRPESVTLGHTSPDGDQGYPGRLEVTATYALNDHDELSVDYQAVTDRPTVVNITNHAYWNLAGEGSAMGAMGHILTIPADAYTPVDAGLIPTGELRSVSGTPFDFRTPQAIGERVRDAGEPQIVIGRGYDHNWVVDRAPVGAPRLMARLEEPPSGRVLEVLSTQPGLQFYSGNFLDGSAVGKSGRLYRQGDGVALEPQMFPDTPNRPEFGSVRLDPGQIYRHRIVFRFSVN